MGFEINNQILMAILLPIYLLLLVAIPIITWILNQFFETSKLRKFFRNWPILKGLTLCEWKDFKRALVEFKIKIFLACLPILVSTVLIVAIKKENFFIALTSHFQRGELYLFCGSMLASIFYIATRDRSDSDNTESRKLLFPNRDDHILFVIAMTFFSAIIYALKQQDIWLPELFISISYFYLLTIIFLSILASTINNALSGNALKYSIEATNAFKKEYQPGKDGN